jgi:hypothetical protein
MILRPKRMGGLGGRIPDGLFCGSSGMMSYFTAPIRGGSGLSRHLLKTRQLGLPIAH